MGNTYMPKPENRYPNNVSGFEHIWELDMLKGFMYTYQLSSYHDFVRPRRKKYFCRILQLIGERAKDKIKNLDFFFKIWFV